jgi:hypothetical protein
MQSVRWFLFVAAVLVFLLAAVAPQVLGPVHRTAFRAAMLISRVTTPFAMGVLFYVLFTPVGFWMRRSGSGSPSFRRLRRGTLDSYWAFCPPVADRWMERPF